MSDQRTLDGRNGGVVGAVSGAADKLMSSLPAQFLTLVVLNSIFIAALLWYLSGIDANRTATEKYAIEVRERVLGPLVDRCVRKIGGDP